MNGEAPYSWNSRYEKNGFDCQLTIRADTWPDLKKQVDEAVEDLIQGGAVPAVMIYRAKPSGNSSTPLPPATTRPIPSTTTNPAPATYARRGPGRPRRIIDTYRGPDGLEYCAHLIDTPEGVKQCGARGEWAPDRKDPAKTWWKCPEYWAHRDYIEYKAKHPDPEPGVRDQTPEQVAEQVFSEPERPF